MKRIIKKIMPFVLAVLIVFQTIYTSVQTAQAAAIPEVLYYTYWDLISSLYGVCGYDTKIDESVINNHSVTGKQAWDNFVTFVENSAKANYKFLGDGASKAFSELENLVNNVTENGFSLTQDLYDMLKSVFADQVVNESLVVSGQYPTISSFNEAAQVIASVCGTSVESVPCYGSFSSGYYLYIFWSNSCINVFEYNSLVVSAKPEGITFANGYSNSYFTGVTYQNGRYKTGSVHTGTDFHWIVLGGLIVNNSSISAQVSEGACPKEVPEVVPWRKEVTVPDEWRVIPGGGSDDDPDKKPDALPVVIPIKPSPGKDPDSTEDPSTETPEDPDKNDDPDKKKDPVVNPIINPDTGNVVDPNTGLDIDPATGKLIDPDTGELIDPDMSDSVNKVNKYGDITKLFPFCIPFDLVKLIKGMSAEKAPPVFHFEHKFKGINYTFVVDVDLSDYDKYIKVFRFGLQVIFVITLMFLTVKFSKLFS